MRDFGQALEHWIQPEIIGDLLTRFTLEEIARKSMTISLLTLASTKTIKDATTINGILYLSPATGTSRISLCPWSNPSCRASCIIHSGRMRQKNARMARIFRTIKFLIYPDLFHNQLIYEIACLEKRALFQNKTPVVRLNGTSDVQNARMFRNLPQAERLSQIPALFPKTRFTEYTKNPRPQHSHANQSITFSYSGTNLNQALNWLSEGRNVAVVFENALPVAWQGHPVIDGDQHDNRFKDRPGVIVGLSLKGTLEARRSAISGKFAV